MGKKNRHIISLSTKLITRAICSIFFVVVDFLGIYIYMFKKDEDKDEDEELMADGD